jgi:CBS domain containing-hemolysin-like protein
MESVILSVPHAYVNLLEKQGRRSGRILHKLHRNIDQPLAAILSLNTVANTIGSIAIGQQAYKIWGDEILGIVSGLMTILILVCAEIIPKTLGAYNAKRLAPLAAYIISMMIIVTYPFVMLSRLINRLFASGSRRGTSREEMIATAEIGVDQGIIHQKESRIIKNLLMLDTIRVAEIMTPRSVVNAMDQNLSVGEIFKTYRPVRFSRIPIYDDNFDHVVGLLHRLKLMEAASHDQFDKKLKDLIVPIHTVTEETTVSVALDQFLKRHEHLFLVVDEYGTPSGIVTLEDAIETLLGVEIVDERDSVADMRQYALEQWRLKKQALKG